MRALPLLLLAAGCAATAARVEADRAVLENDLLKVIFLPDGAGLFAKQQGGWVPVALLRRKFAGGEIVEAPFPAIHFPGEAEAWFTLKGGQIWIESAAELPVEIVGRRDMALFPGLEFLEGDEPSSSDRDARGPLADRRRPDFWKITVPLMAVETEGVLVALLWNEPLDAFFEAREKSRMALSPTPGRPGHGVARMVLHVEEGGTILDAVPRWIETFGFPAPEHWPRTLEEEIALCKEGFATVADGTGRHRHCVGWKPDWTPGFAVLRHLAGEKVDWSAFPDLLWNGLVYAYYLRKLAPLDKAFDWLRVADGITASAVHQQYADGPSKGCYPDAVYDRFTRRSPADINPENILINILAALGKDPDPDLKLRP